jgi:hypothetical protein
MVAEVCVIGRTTPIDIANLSAGQYTVVLIIDNRRLTKKFAKRG